MYLFERERARRRGRGRGRESLKQTILSPELEAGLDLTTLRS